MLRTVFVVPIIAFFFATIACQNNNSLAKSEEDEIEEYRKRIVEVADSGDFQKGLQLSKELYELANKGHSNLFRFCSASTYGQALITLGEPEKGKKVLDEAMQLSYSLNVDTILGEIFNGYGLYEQFAGNNYAASEYYLKALEYVRKCNDKSLLSTGLINLAGALTDAGDSTGLRYALEAYKIAEDNNIMEDKVWAIKRVIGQHINRKDYKELEKWTKRFLEEVPPSMKTDSLYMLEEMYRLKGDLKKATYYTDLLIAMTDTAKNIIPIKIADNYFLKARLLNEEGKYGESNQWVDKLMDYLRKSPNGNHEKRATKLYADNYEHLGNYKEALEYRNKQVEDMADKVNTDRIKILKAKEVALDVAQKDDEIAQQKDHARMLKWIIWGTLGFIVMLIGLCTYIYKMYKDQRQLMSVIVERAQTDEEVVEKLEKQVDDRHAELFHQMKHELDDKKMFLDVNLSRESLAEHLGTNRTYISEAVSQMTGMNFPQYINRLRVSEAERRLHDATIDVSNLTEFGRTLGFASLSAFQNAFKRQTGMTLSAYREIARNKPTPSLSA